MATIAIKKEPTNYAQVSNICLEDNTITALAKAIYAYMVGRPEGWTLRANDVYKKFKESKNTIHKGINELRQKGYVFRFREYSKGKRGVLRWHYIIMTKPSTKSDALKLHPKNWDLNKVFDIPTKNTSTITQTNKIIDKDLDPKILDLNLCDTYNKQYRINNKKKTSFSIGRSLRNVSSKRLEFIFSDNDKPLAKDSWCGTYVLKTQAERPILNIVSRLSRQKVKPDPVAIEEVVNHWNSFADRCKHNDLQVMRHNLATSKTLYKIQVLVTSLLADGTTTDGIKKAIDNFEDLLLRSPHYSHNRRFSLPMFLIMPQSDPGRLFDDCLTGEYASSKKYFPNKYKKTLTYFVDLMINREKSANGHISDKSREAIIDYLAPDEYLHYLMEKGGTREECRAIVKKERKKLLTYLQEV